MERGREGEESKQALPILERAKMGTVLRKMGKMKNKNGKWNERRTKRQADLIDSIQLVNAQIEVYFDMVITYRIFVRKKCYY